MIKKITPEKLLEIESIFKEKNWEIDSDANKYASLFNRFCSRCSLFDEEKQDLLIELTKDFLKIGFQDFQRFFLSAFKKIPIFYIQSAVKIFIMPLKTPSTNETKSSGILWYTLKNYSDFSYEKHFNKVTFIDNPDKIKHKEKLGKYLMLFIDDFIGTGETASSTIAEILSTEYNGFKLPKDRIIILSLIGQNQGVSFLNETFGINCITGLLRFKGISDAFPPEQAETKIQIMNQIEDFLKILPEFRLGYGSSEALVSLEIKSPNNTFPVYWHETTKMIAPFPRKKRYEKTN